jgi:ABC-type Fe3+ transport system permease subunit
MRKFKTWPLLLLLAAIYWGREVFGFKDVRDLNDVSSAALHIALPCFFLALLLLLLRLFRRKDKEPEQLKEKPARRR